MVGGNKSFSPLGFIVLLESSKDFAGRNWAERYVTKIVGRPKLEVVSVFESLKVAKKIQQLLISCRRVTLISRLYPVGHKTEAIIQGMLDFYLVKKEIVHMIII